MKIGALCLKDDDQVVSVDSDFLLKPLDKEMRVKSIVGEHETKWLNSWFMIVFENGEKMYVNRDDVRWIVATLEITNE